MGKKKGLKQKKIVKRQREQDRGEGCEQLGVAVGGKKKSLSHLHYSNVVPTTTAHEQKNGRKKHGRNNIMKKQDEKQSLTL